jgi:hypothetical protein
MFLLLDYVEETQGWLRPETCEGEARIVATPNKMSPNPICRICKIICK